ncbi:MAG: radical SAM protein [Elusimicrobiota bacterium]|jgi:uncharacterized protein|nr:radical SAM protein [Elusimicrobiota bacterium]
MQLITPYCRRLCGDDKVNRRTQTLKGFNVVNNPVLPAKAMRGHKETKMQNFLRNKIKTIFISLGGGCNLSCSYCSQKKEHIENIAVVNKDIYRFIKEHASYHSKSDKLKVLFYGGEPLLYFDKIKTIAKKIKSKKIHFTIITNGKLLNQEIVKFLNKYKFGVQVSWDGRASLESRGFDAVKEKKDLLFKLNSMSFSSIITDKLRLKDLVEDIETFNTEYAKRNNGRIANAIVDAVRDRNNAAGRIDYNVLEQDMRDLIKSVFVEGKNESFKYWFNLEFKNLRNFITVYKDKQSVLSPCPEGLQHISINLKGDILHCHNASGINGTIYSDYYEYLSKVLSKTKSCQEGAFCEVYSLCKGGCKLANALGENTDIYCQSRKALLKPILEFVSYLHYALTKEVVNV